MSHTHVENSRHIWINKSYKSEKEQYELEWWIFRSNERNEFIQDLSMPDLISDCKENDNVGDGHKQGRIAPIHCPRSCQG